MTIRVVRPAELETESASGALATLAIRVETAGATASKTPRGAFLSANGSILGLTVVGSHPLTFPVSAKGGAILCEFMTPRSCEPFSLSSMWSAAEGLPHVDSLTSQAVGWPEENEDSRICQLIEMLRIAEPDVEHVTPSQDSDHVHGVDTSFRVFMTSRPSPVPLEDLGDGAFHLLGLALSLVQTGKGLLLVDEIDTGLHYSVMRDMWRLVVQTAKQCDIQVFATTHSLDCVRGLAWLCRNHPELRDEVSLQKIMPTLEESVPFDAEKIMIAAEADTEVR